MGLFKNSPPALATPQGVTITQESDTGQLIKNLLGLAAVLTCYFNIKFFYGLWRPEHNWDAALDWLSVVAAAVLVTAFEGVLWYECVKRKSLILGFIAFLVSFVSILGSLGVFESGVLKNILESDQYQTKRAITDLQVNQVKSWQESAKDRTGHFWANSKAEKALEAATRGQSELDNIVKEGATGTGNALFSSLAADLSITSGAAARGVNKYIAVVLELAYVVLLALKANKDNRRTPPQQTQTQQLDFEAALNRAVERLAAQQTQGANGNGHISTPPPRQQYNSTPPSETEMKEKRKRMLKRYLEENPGASMSEMASAIGVSSPATVKKYLEEIDHGGHHTQGERFASNSVTIPQELSPANGFKIQPGFIPPTTRITASAGDKPESPGTTQERVVYVDRPGENTRYFLTDEDRQKAEALKQSQRNYIKGLVLEFLRENPDAGGRKIAKHVNGVLASSPVKNRRGKRLKNRITHVTALELRNELKAESKL